MSFWSDTDWKREGSDGRPLGASVVEPFFEAFAVHADYTLSIGDEVYLSGQDKQATIKKLQAGEDFIVSPGQFCFFITGEIVRLKQSQLGFISIRATTKFYGLVNVSGFHVDPGYNGRLIFSAFNAGPTAIHLKQGDRIFSLWVSDLETPAEAPTKPGYMSIPASLVNKISGEFLTAYQLREQIAAADEKIKSLEESRRNLRVYGVVALLVLGFFFKDAVLDAATGLRNWLAQTSAQSHGQAQSSPTASSPPAP